MLCLLRGGLRHWLTLDADKVRLLWILEELLNKSRVYNLQISTGEKKELKNKIYINPKEGKKGQKRNLD